MALSTSPARNASLPFTFSLPAANSRSLSDHSCCDATAAATGAAGAARFWLATPLMDDSQASTSRCAVDTSSRLGSCFKARYCLQIEPLLVWEAASKRQRTPTKQTQPRSRTRSQSGSKKIKRRDNITNILSKCILLSFFRRKHIDKTLLHMLFKREVSAFFARAQHA